MDTIFSHFISRGEDGASKRRLAYASWFIESIPESEFKGDDLIFYKYLEFSDKLGVSITYRYFQVWLDTELTEILHKTKAKVTGTETLNFEEPVSFATACRVTKDVMSDNFNVLEKTESQIDDFKIDIASYFNRKRKERLTQALASTYDLLNQAGSVTEASAYALDNIGCVDAIYDVTKLDALNTSTSSDNKEDKLQKVTDSGLPAIDADSLGIYETQLFDIEAQPGIGKTRFLLGTFVYRALTVYKKNVAVFALEQTEEEVKNMLIARHVFTMFNIQVNSKMLNTGLLPEDVQTKVEAAKIDLFESGKYGKLYAEECSLYVETFISKFRTTDRLKGPFDLICIDYVGLVESRPAQFQKQLMEFEIIRNTLRYFKQYLRNTRKAGITISQFNGKGITAGENDKEITTEMAQGGPAVYRNTDYNIALSCSNSMRLQQKRRVSQPKVRDSKGFDTFIVDTRLGFCYFRQVAQKKV